MAQTRKKKKDQVSRTFKPADMTLEQWQTELRRQFGRQQRFKLQRLGDDPVFSEFSVTNPQSQSSYRVLIRGGKPGDNYCSCPDYATNVLGTCKHLEFVLARLRRVPGSVARMRRGFRPTFSEVLLRYGAQREVRFVPGTECPPNLAREGKLYFDDSGLLRPDAFPRFELFLKAAEKSGHDLRCAEDALGFIAEVRDGARRREVIDRAFAAGIDSPALSGVVKTELYPYQREGALFAARAGRCLIGDEMGLGKTVQAIAAAEIMARHFGVSRALIVCPTSLKHQWEREVARFTDRKAVVIGGLRPRRQDRFAEESFFKITNYDTVHRDLDLIQAWAPELVILDEAQRIKNWNTRAARAVKRIVSPFAIVLTGTPLENRLEELVSIVQFVDRHRLGPTFRFLADHQVQDDVGRVVGYRDLDTIGRTLAPVLLRRRKSQVVQQLPERMDKNFFVPMTPQQMEHHEENREIVARLVHKWRTYRFLSESDQRRLLVSLQNMRMSCNSTYLLDQATDHGVKADELVTLLGEIFERPESKAVVFSQWLRTHEILAPRLKSRGYGHVLFHGGVPGEKRKALIDRFREDGSCRAFLSTDAGGVGLNLQHASVVVNMDLPWNPAVLEQRIGRVHRLGQKQPVQVVNFVSQGTIEEGMLSVLKFKKSLFSGALDGGEKEIFFGGSRLKRFMETVEKATTQIPAPPPAEEPAEPDPAPARAPAPAAEPVEEPVPTPAGPWDGLLRAGLSFLEQLSSAHGGQPGRGATPAASLVRRDEKTGQNYLHLPMPSAEVIEQLVRAAEGLLGQLRR